MPFFACDEAAGCVAADARAFDWSNRLQSQLKSNRLLRQPRRLRLLLNLSLRSSSIPMQQKHL
jgi:hypothetical protein